MKGVYCLVMLFLAAATVGCDVTFNMHEPEATVVRETSPIASSPPAPTAAAPTSSPEPRPAWVDESSGLHGGDYMTKVLIGPESDRAACEAKLPRLVEGVVADYVAREYGPEAPARFDLNYSTLRSRVVADTWEETVNNGDEPGTFLHVQLRFDDKLRAEWKGAVEHWTTTTRTYILFQGLSLGMAAILVLHLTLRFGGQREGET